MGFPSDPLIGLRKILRRVPCLHPSPTRPVAVSGSGITYIDSYTYITMYEINRSQPK